MINVSIVMDNGQVYNYSDIIGLTLQHGFNGKASIRFFNWYEIDNYSKLSESAWSIGDDSDVESIVIKRG